MNEKIDDTSETTESSPTKVKKGLNQENDKKELLPVVVTKRVSFTQSVYKDVKMLIIEQDLDDDGKITSSQIGELIEILIKSYKNKSTI